MMISKRTGGFFREDGGRLALIASRSAAGGVQFPPSPFIHGPEQPTDVPLGHSGSLYTYTVVHPGRDRAPYALAMVDFDGGVRVFGRLLDGLDRDLPLGSEVIVVPHALEDGTPDYAFRLGGQEAA